MKLKLRTPCITNGCGIQHTTTGILPQPISLLRFPRARTRRKVPQIRISFESEDRSYFLYSKTRNSVLQRFYASHRILFTSIQEHPYIYNVRVYIHGAHHTFESRI